MTDDKKKPIVDPDELDELPDVVLSDKTRAMRTISDTEEIPSSLDDEDPGVRDELSDVIKKEDEKDNGGEKRNAEDTGESEIPSSLMDEDPGVRDELSDVLKEDENTDEIPEDHTEAVKPPEPVPQKKFSDYARQSRPSRKKKHSGIRIVIWILFILMIVLLGLGCFEIYRNLQPVSSTSEEVPFEVEENENLRTVSQSLEDQGIVHDGDLVYLYGRMHHLTDIKHGAFLLDKSWTMEQILTTLNDESASQADSVYVSINEGDWAKDAAKKIAAATNVSADDLIALWSNQDWIRSKMPDYPFLTEEMFQDGVRIYLEGYLSPYTYLFKKETTAEDVTTEILDQTNAVYQKYAGDIAASGHSIHQIYTMASILQYEAGGSPDDLSKVASVFYNRMNADMPLQSSVTVCYAIDFDSNVDNWQACEVNTDFDSPYNTYLHKGLPPGAIENPGERALYAAIHPADTNYYYFMADVNGDGTIYYAETLEEHNANVEKYLQ